MVGADVDDSPGAPVGEESLDDDPIDLATDVDELIEPSDDVGDTDQPADGSSLDRRRFIRAVSIGGGLAFVPFIVSLWNYGFAPSRTAVPGGFFSNFYDLQARAFMDGRIDVPKGSLAIEAFVVDGRDYIYFPPFPSILRIPFLWIGGDGLDGRLTAPFILVAWLLTTVLVALLLWRLRTILRPNTSLGRLEAWCYGAFVLTACGGSIMVFIASLPWVYHEAYAWGIAGAVGTVFSLIGLIERPGWRGAVATGCWTTMAILSRTTSGWACAFAVMMCGAWFLLGRRGAEARPWWWATALAGFIPLLIGGSFNYAKFRHPWLFPLDTQVWTQVNEHRREALAANGGNLVGPQFFTTSLVNYFRPDGIRFTSIFPFITLPADAAPAYNGAFVDQAYRTGSVTAFMPGLFVMAVWGLIVTFTRSATERLRWMRIPVLAALGVTVGVMFYGYLAHRYTAEFFPVLVIAGAIGVVHVAGRIDDASVRIRRTAIIGVTLVVAFSVSANTATAFWSARTVTGGSSLRDYVIIQERIGGLTGGQLDGYIDVGDDLPDDGPTDHLRIIGDCEALYLATGDSYQPWLPVEVREASLDILPLSFDEGDPPDTPSGEITLLTFDGIEDRDLVLERIGRSTFRLVLGDGPNRSTGPYFRAPPGFRFQVIVRADPEAGRFRLEGPLFWVRDVGMSSHEDDWISLPTLLRVPDFETADANEQSDAQGVAITSLPTPRPALCSDLLDR